ncbi:MAG: ATP-binding protein [Oscillochloris sp.]|nr:ATP-binding protein [Oscillochloris sp.]
MALAPAKHSAPLLIALKGHPGCGKSAVSRALGIRLKIAVVDKDDIKDLLVGYPDPGGLAYVAMFRIARRQLLHGVSVVCDSPLSEAQGYAAARRVASEVGAQLVVIECICSDPILWRQRIEQRAALGEPTHEIASWSDLQQHMHRRSASYNYPIDVPHLIIDSTQARDTIETQAIEWVQGINRRDDPLP